MKQKDYQNPPGYVFPSIELLSQHDELRKGVSSEEIDRKRQGISEFLSENNVDVKDVQVISGPSVSLFKVHLGPKGRAATVRALVDDLSIYLGIRGARVVAMEDCVGIEIANDKPSAVPLRSILESPEFRESSAKLPIAIGYSIRQKPMAIDLAEAPHILMAGATKQGKSIAIHSLVASLLYAKHPSEVQFVFIDPKGYELQMYGGLLNHYLAVLPDVKNAEDEAAKSIASFLVRACDVLNSLVTEMNNRRANSSEDRPYIVVVIDEIADLTVPFGGKEAEKLARQISKAIIMLVQKGRAAGIHLVLTTQRPSVDVITGLIKANIPTRMAFRVSSRIDSMTIIDMPGAERLIGNGDMIISTGTESERVQGAYVSKEEVAAIVNSVAAQKGHGRSYSTPHYLPVANAQSLSEKLDERFEEAARLVVTTQIASIAYLQRKLGMGYAKAGRIMNQLESAQIVGATDGTAPRKVLVESLEKLENLLAGIVEK